MWVWLGAGVALVAVVATATLSLGVYNVAADDPHSRPVYALLETARERSIEVRAAKLQLPTNLDDPERIRQGAGNYNAMCVTCHLSPDAAATEMSKGLYPAPPNLSKQPVAPAEAFWVIKHGIKASGMPAWGGSMDDEFIWNMSAFLQVAHAGRDCVQGTCRQQRGPFAWRRRTQGHHDDERPRITLPYSSRATTPCRMRTRRAWTTITTARHPATRKSGW